MDVSGPTRPTPKVPVGRAPHSDVFQPAPTELLGARAPAPMSFPPAPPPGRGDPTEFDHPLPAPPPTDVAAFRADEPTSDDRPAVMDPVRLAHAREPTELLPIKESGPVAPAPVLAAEPPAPRQPVVPPTVAWSLADAEPMPPPPAPEPEPEPEIEHVYVVEHVPRSKARVAALFLLALVVGVGASVGALHGLGVVDARQKLGLAPPPPPEPDPEPVVEEAPDPPIAVAPLPEPAVVDDAADDDDEATAARADAARKRGFATQDASGARLPGLDDALRAGAVRAVKDARVDATLVVRKVIETKRGGAAYVEAKCDAIVTQGPRRRMTTALRATAAGSYTGKAARAPRAERVAEIVERCGEELGAQMVAPERKRKRKR